MKLSPSRVTAFEILTRIEVQHEFSSSLLHQYQQKLDEQDRRLCHELVLGTLRRQLLLDKLIKILTKSRKLDIEVRIILRLGLYQLYYLDKIPNHAIVNEAVGLTVRARKSSARGLVNAVLRSASREKPELVFEDEIDGLSIETSHPKWLVEKWTQQFGFELCQKLAIANNEPPKTYFRKTPLGIDATLPEDVREFHEVPGCFLANSIGSKLRELVDDGKIYVQDAGSQMVANAVTIESGNLFLDVCASPGGKTMAIVTNSLVSGQTNTRFYAGDLTDRRINLLSETIIKQKGKAEIVQYDAQLPLPFEENTFDRVLVDAPCTGTGTIRHNPEIRYFVQPKDFGRMQQRQIAILNNAANLLKHGGLVIYSTCSIEPEENEMVCEQFLAGRDDFRQAAPQIPVRFVTKNGYGRTFPATDDMDGFFIATFERI